MSERASTLAAGRRHVSEERHRGWLIRIVRAPILNNSDNSVSGYSTGAWKRELSMTTVAGQSLPGATFGGNSLELVHEASGVRICFCAMDALRSWRLFDPKPVPHLSALAPVPTWDYSFTTPYAGTVDYFPAGTVTDEPDGCSLYSRPAVDLASGAATLRKPLCQCRGASGRECLIRLSKESASPAGVSKPEPAPPPPRLPPPAWEPCHDVSVDIDALLRTLAQPRLVEQLELWRDDVEPHSTASLHVRVLLAENFWVCVLRCFVRVNGVMGRVLDTRFVCHLGDDGTAGGSPRVLRERSWREGDWAALAGMGATAHVNADLVNDRVAASRLPLLREPITEALALPTARRGLADAPCTLEMDPRRGSGGGGGGGEGGHDSSDGQLWQRSLGSSSEVLCAGSAGLAFAVLRGGASIEAVLVSSGAAVWQRGPPTAGSLIMSTALSPDGGDGGRLAVGTDRAEMHVWRAATAEPLSCVRLSPAASLGARPPSPRATSVQRWVERIVWSRNGQRIGVAAGRCVVIASSRTAETMAQWDAPGTVYSLAFAPAAEEDPKREPSAEEVEAQDGDAQGGDAHGDGTLAIGAYGGVSWLAEDGRAQGRAPLTIGAAAVLSVAVSKDGRQLAAGCLDKRVRVFPLCGPPSDDTSAQPTAANRDWVGFEGPVAAVAWNACSSWLAAAGGRTLLAMPRTLAPGEAPTLLCVAHGSVSQQPPLSAIAWCCPPTSTGGGGGGGGGGGRPASSLLAAVEAGSACRAHLFDVALSSDTVPRRAAPLATYELPSGSPLSTLAHPRLAFAAEAVDCRSAAKKGEDTPPAEPPAEPLTAPLTLLVSVGDVLAAFNVPESPCVGGRLLSTTGPRMGTLAQQRHPDPRKPAAALPKPPTPTPVADGDERHQFARMCLSHSPESVVAEAFVVVALASTSCLSAPDLCRLGSVCRAFHHSIKATPAVWAHVDLSPLRRPTQFFDGGYSRLERFGDVRSLTLQFCDELRDAHLRLLPPSLRILVLDACHRITDAGIKAVAESCGKRLESLSVYWNNHISNSSALSLSLRCPMLTSLSLSGCKLVGATGVLGLSSRLRRLRSLNLTRLPLVDDTALGAVAQANPGLQELRLFAASQYTDAPILTVAGHCTQLSYIDFTGLGKLTDAAIVALGTSCHQLQTVLLSWATGVTDVGVVALARGCPLLAALSLHGLKKIGEPALDALAACCKDTLVEIDVRGCLSLGERRLHPEELVKILPRLTNFILHKG
jgi:hypothetical protein